jgi:hypothetical protein
MKNFELKKIKKGLKEKMKLVKATILSGTMLFAMTGCAPSEKQQENIEYNTGNSISDEIIPVTSKEEKTTESTKTTAVKTEKATYITDTGIVVELPTDIDIEEKTEESKVEPTTNKTTNKTTNTSNTTNKTNETKKENVTTNKQTTKSEKLEPHHVETKETQQNHVEKTTPAVTSRKSTPVTTKKTEQTHATTKKTTQQTQATTRKTTQTTPTTVATVAPTTEAPKPIETEPVTVEPTEPIAREYNKYDLLSQDPEIADEAFEFLTHSLSEDLFRGTSYKSYKSISESAALILELNYNQDLNQEMLERSCLKFNEEEFYDKFENIHIADYELRTNVNVDFNKYVIDENYANLINNICERYDENYSFMMDDGIDDGLEQELRNYLDSNSQNINNYSEYCFMANVAADYLGEVEISEQARNEFNEHALKPLYEKIHGRQYTR